MVHNMNRSRPQSQRDKMMATDTRVVTQRMGALVTTATLYITYSTNDLEITTSEPHSCYVSFVAILDGTLSSIARL